MDAAVAIVVAATISVAGPLLLDWRAGRRRERERMEDFARQDAVARKLDQAGAEVRGMSGVIAKVAENTDKLVVQTDGVSHRVEQLAGLAGKLEGREEMRAEQAAEKAKE